MMAVRGSTTGSPPYSGRAALGALATALLFSGCAGFDCENEIKQQATSPDGVFKAVVFDRDCGATTGFNTQVSILDAASNLPNDGGNTLILDESIDLKLHWRSNELLNIAGISASPHVFRQETLVKGIQISYNAED